MTGDGPEPIVHRKLYPPAPERKMPEWGDDDTLIRLDFPANETSALTRSSERRISGERRLLQDHEARPF
jgi:hypothetical protein